MAFCRTAGFARVELRKMLAHSACVACYRSWEDRIDPTRPAPTLVSAFHNTREGINFCAERDEYVTIWFENVDGPLGRDDVWPSVGDYGTKPMFVGPRPDGTWQANFKLPPGLDSGWHPVRVRVRNGPPSNSLEIAVDLPVPDRRVMITSVADGKTWVANQLRLDVGRTLALWVRDLPRNADKNTIRVLLGGRPVPVVYVESEAAEPGTRQINVEVPAATPSGPIDVEVALGGQLSDPASVEISS
jgi:hypothetical protein